MRKDLEATDPQSCWNKAREDELVFVLLGRDKTAPAVIDAWCAERIRIGKNTEGDAQITEARELAAAIREEQTIMETTT
jgi:hypothetical protein